MASPQRIGVIGYGYWGAKHARVLSGLPDVAVTIIDVHDDRLAQARRDFPFARLTLRVDDVLTDLDAVVVATAPRSHAPIALRALRAGCHALVEKPLALSVADCGELVEAAEHAGTVLMVGHTFEYNAAVWKLADLVATGALGDMYYIDCARLNLGRYQTDVNVVWDLAPHDVSIISMLLGRLPSTVSAWAHRSASDLVEDVAYIRLRYTEPDFNAYVHVSWLDPCKVRRVTVVGTEKMAVYNDVSDTERLRIYDSGVALNQDAEPVASMPMSYRYGDVVSPFIPFDEPLAVQDAHFVDCVRGAAVPRTPGVNGLAVVQVLEAAATAVRTGAEVAIAPSSPDTALVRGTPGAQIAAAAAGGAGA